ncbi:amino acid ABC transporter permease [Oscillibacter hominis]|uniref:Amino acid ABC transporter permease n=1 Tax=Oscillibacter hominis TaxID=2763056 RepID=A0A7G9B722_9FIRM|nr:amino acid ABC transporter permease [Oscillibacter hominis]QNL45353.1 amino acid ABC transporter permease [Oscillibacter hominis]
MNIDLLYALKKLPLILSYIHVTLWISICSMAATLVFSLLITIIRYYKIRVLTPIANAYIDLFRGTPLLTQMFFIYYGLAQIIPLFREMQPITAAILVLALNASAYTTENMRSALESVPRGQTEAGLAVGMTDLQVMWHIILPQATKVAVPVLANDFIALLKNSSMAFTLGVREIMGEASLVGNAGFRFFEAYLDAFVIYFCLSKVIGLGQKYLEKRFSIQGRKA